MRVPASLLAAAILGGCASAPTNHFSNFYQNHLAGVPQEWVDENLEPYSGSTVLHSTEDPRAHAVDLKQRGYVCIGVSSFHAVVNPSADLLKEHGIQVGADLVLYAGKYLGTEQRQVKELKVNPGTTTTTHSSGDLSANAFGTRGNGMVTAQFVDTTTTTTQPTLTTELVERTFHTYSHTASYWRKMKPGILGVEWETLPNDMRVRLQRNTGAYVRLIFNDSPAFRANILPGDVIIDISGIAVDSPDQANRLLKRLAGQKVTLLVLRNQTMLQTDTVLNAL